MSAEVMLMLLADARLPTGAHTQSAGLEPALRAGMPVTELPSYVQSRLRTVTLVEAGAAVLARRSVLAATDPGDLTVSLTEIDNAWRARTISPALRETSVLLGRGLRPIGGAAVAGHRRAPAPFPRSAGPAGRSSSAWPAHSRGCRPNS